MVQLEQQIIRRMHRINVSSLPFCSLSLTSTLSSLTLMYFALFSKIFIFFNSFRFFQHENSPFIINNKGLNRSKYSGPKWHIQRSRSVSRGPKVQPISRGPNMKTQGSRSKLTDIKSKIQIKVQTRLFFVFVISWEHHFQNCHFVAKNQSNLTFSMKIWRDLRIFLVNLMRIKTTLNWILRQEKY